MCVLIFSTIFAWNISYSKKNWAKYDQKCALVFMKSTGYYCQILMKLGIILIDFFKNTQVSDFMNIRYVGAVLFHAN